MVRGTPAEQQNRKFKTLHTKTSTKRKLKEQLEIVRAKKEGKQLPIKNVTKFKSKNYLDW